MTDKPKCPLKEYTAEDFEYDCHDMGEFGKLIRLRYAAEKANRLQAAHFEEWKKNLRMAHGNKHQNLDVMFWQTGEYISGKENQTHSARIFDIEEL